MAKTPEGKVKDPVLKWARLNGIKYIPFYFRVGVHTGWPDTLFLIPGGRPFLLEAKARGKEPTKKQELRIKELLELGYDTGWYDNEDEAIEALTYALETARLPKESSKVPLGARGRCTVFRPRIRQDKYNARRVP